ncbi:MAG: glycosyltransferase family 2 protein [Candidatus Nanopelagicales bacterium]
MIEFDSSVRRLEHDVLVGGYPLRLLRLTPEAANALTTSMMGMTTSTGTQIEKFLIDQGFAHAVRPLGLDAHSQVTAVVPAFIPGQELRIDPQLRTLATIVVDDGNQPQLVGSGQGLSIVRTGSRPSGPAVARNLGVNRVRTDLILFTDHDVVLTQHLIEALSAHFDDSRVVAAAPRIVTLQGRGLASLLERGRCALDLGPHRAWVRPGHRVSYVPSAVLMVRRSAFETAHGFDPRLLVGEDVDLVWRLSSAGRLVYDANVIAGHRARPNLRDALRRRMQYGMSAAALEQRHPGRLRHLEVPGIFLAPVLGLLLGGPVGGAAGTLLATLPAQRRLVSIRRSQAMGIAVRGQVQAWRSVARYAVRPALPVTALAASMSPRFRNRLLPVLAAGYLTDLALRARESRALQVTAEDPAVLVRVPVEQAMIAGVVDDLAYSAGVWLGCIQRRSFAALIPKVQFSWSRRSRTGSRVPGP